MNATPPAQAHSSSRTARASATPEPLTASTPAPAPAEGAAEELLDARVTARPLTASFTMATQSLCAPQPVLVAPKAAQQLVTPLGSKRADLSQPVVDACIQQSVSLRDRGACSEALEHIDAVFAKYELSAAQQAALLQHKGRLAQQLCAFATAIEHYTSALDCDPHASAEEKSQILFQLAMAKHLWRARGEQDAPSKNAVDNAFALASGALRVEVEGARPTPERRSVIVHNQGFLHEQLGQYAEALTHYQEALRLRYMLGDVRGQGYSLHRMAIVADVLGQKLLAAEASSGAVAAYRAANITGQPRVAEAEQLERAMSAKLVGPTDAGAGELA